MSIIKKKYWIIINNELQRQFTKRVDIASYAFGNISDLLALIIIWSAVFKNTDMIKGYTSGEMISYVVFSWFFAFLTSNYAFEQNVARDIQLGTLSNFLVKPISLYALHGSNFSRKNFDSFYDCSCAGGSGYVCI